MKRLTEKFWFLTAALSLLAALSTFVAVAGNHQISKESSSELVDIVEEVEAIANRSQRRVKRKQTSDKFLVSISATHPKLSAPCRFFKPSHERDRFNGLGGYLLT